MTASSSGPFRIVVITLFEGFFVGPLETSLLGKAVARGDIAVEYVNPRDFTTDKHRTVDDTPYGGGPGMVLKPGPIVAAIEQAKTIVPAAPVVLLTPQGSRLTATRAAQLAAEPGMILICGRYEGFDERIRAFVDEEVTIGDYVLSGGEPAALVVIDTISRQIDGVLGNAESTLSESFAGGLLEYPQYTRPPMFRGMAVPDVLISGNHARIEAWRREEALTRTRTRRPDLLQLADEQPTGATAPAADRTTRGGATADPER